MGVKNFKYLSFVLISPCMVSMEWSGDVFLKNVFNDSGKIIKVEILKDDTLLTSAEFESKKDIPQPWLNYLHSKKTDAPNRIVIKERGYSYIPTGNIKELDLVIEKATIQEIPSGSKFQLVATEDTPLAMKQMSRTGVPYETVLITRVINDSGHLASISVNHSHLRSVNPKSTKTVNIEVKNGHAIKIKTFTHNFTYVVSGKVERLQITIDKKGMAIISEQS